MKFACGVSGVVCSLAISCICMPVPMADTRVRCFCRNMHFSTLHTYYSDEANSAGHSYGAVGVHHTYQAVLDHYVIQINMHLWGHDVDALAESTTVFGVSASRCFMVSNTVKNALYLLLRREYGRVKGPRSRGAAVRHAGRVWE